MATNIDPMDRREQTVVEQEPGDAWREVYIEDTSATRRQGLYQASALISYLFVLLEGMIALRILLKLIGANPSNAFASFIYNFTGLFLSPFIGLTPTPAVGGMVLEISSMVAMIVYALLAWALIRLMWLLFYQPSDRVVSQYEREHTRSHR
ncbi:MAG: YggT family protein [Chloroflexi bacterium]|nr:YggT family protein [Chloroflexota bacterium]